jgi:3-oxoacyl-[acyl-carrier-protein] synthase II
MYIQSTAAVTPQASFETILTQPDTYSGDKLPCVEPDYTTYIDSKQIRRMSRVIKMGVAAAMDCLKAAGIQQPGAFVTGTAYGCLADTEAFLSRMVSFNEELLSPTSFIQSTHNTVGAQIALMLQCHNYNNTFVHRGFSFENALSDASLLLAEKEADNVLVGAVDEIVDASHAILQRFGLYKNREQSVALLEQPGKGTMNGEGAVFFLVNGEKQANSMAKLNEVHTFYKPVSNAAIELEIDRFLTSQDITIDEVDIILTGLNGDTGNDAAYTSLQSSVFNNKPLSGFKHLCGEYPTATAFAVWLAANILHTGKLPASVGKNAQAPKRILIYNHQQHIHHALFLLTAC